MSRLAFALVLALAPLAALGCAHASSTPEARKAVIEANMWELQDCWVDVMGHNSGKSGSMLFSVELRANGSVDWVEIEVDEIDEPRLAACTVRRIKKWKFPEDTRGRSVEFGVGFTG